MYGTVHESSIGPLTLVVDDAGAVTHILFRPGGIDYIEDRQRCSYVMRELDEYFAGRRRGFELQLAPRGTDFQLGVWRELERIPFGETISYLELATRIGNPKAVRAVGAANGANPISIVVPCHRVIGANGSLTGYGGGLPLKQQLLALEQPQRSFLIQSNREVYA